MRTRGKIKLGNIFSTYIDSIAQIVYVSDFSRYHPQLLEVDQSIDFSFVPKMNKS